MKSSWRPTSRCKPVRSSHPRREFTALLQSFDPDRKRTAGLLLRIGVRPERRLGHYRMDRVVPGLFRPGVGGSGYDIRRVVAKTGNPKTTRTSTYESPANESRRKDDRRFPRKFDVVEIREDRQMLPRYCDPRHPGIDRARNIDRLRCRRSQPELPVGLGWVIFVDSLRPDRVESWIRPCRTTLGVIR